MQLVLDGQRKQQSSMHLHKEEPVETLTMTARLPADDLPASGSG